MRSKKNVSGSATAKSRAIRLQAAATVVIAAISVITPAVAWAIPSPNSGPTSGGTEVMDSVIPVNLALPAGGLSHLVALGSDGSAYAWGLNSSGAVGIGSWTSTSSPMRAHTPDGVALTSVAAGFDHSMAIGSDGNTYAWGANTNGQLGNGANLTSNLPVPVELPDGVVFTDVFGGKAPLGMALGSDGHTYAWGSNTFGQLGIGTYDSSTNTNVPVQVSAPTGVTFQKLSIGSTHVLALGTDGGVYAWGQGTEGQLGNGATTYRQTIPTPVTLPTGVEFIDIAAGGHYSAALGSDGNIYTWGLNTDGQLGIGNTTQSNSPVRAHTPPGVTFTSFDAGYTHTLAIDSTGQLYAWGLNASWGFGDGTATSASTPVAVPPVNGITFTAIGAGNSYSVAQGSDGNIYTWGQMYSGTGQYGPHSERPELLPSDVAITGVSFGGEPAALYTQQQESWTAVTPEGLCGNVDVEVDYAQFGVAKTIVTEGGFTFGAAPWVTSNPSDHSMSLGDTHTLTAAGAGDPMPTMQWQRATDAEGTWEDIAGATEANLPISPTSSGYYRALFLNCAGTQVSDVATVNVSTPGGNESSGGGTGDQTTQSSSTVLARTGVDSSWTPVAGALTLVLLGIVAFGLRRLGRE